MCVNSFIFIVGEIVHSKILQVISSSLKPVFLITLSWIKSDLDGHRKNSLSFSMQSSVYKTETKQLKLFSVFKNEIFIMLD